MRHLRKIFAAATVVLLVGSLFAWRFVVEPKLTSLSRVLPLDANVISIDNFYNEARREYDGAQYSKTKFSYRAVGEKNGVLLVENEFDVRTFEGAPIFAVRRTYGVNPATGQLVPGYGDASREGYLFAPRQLKPGQPFIYWHVNYNGPALMTYVGQEVRSGVPVAHYESYYEGVHIDQTESLTPLPEVGKTRGIEVEPHLELWVEPVTGMIVDYRDDSVAYYYDLATQQRIYPWNHFTNRMSQASVVKNISLAQQQKYLFYTLHYGVPVGLLLGGVWIVGQILRDKRNLRPRLRTHIGVAVIVFLLLSGPLLFVSQYSYARVRDTLSENVSFLAEQHAVSAARALKERFDRMVDIGTVQGGRSVVREAVERGAWQEAIISLREIDGLFPYIEYAALYDSSGVLQATTNGLEQSDVQRNFSSSDFYRGVVKTGKPYVGNVVILSGSADQAIVPIAVPLFATTQELKGVLMLAVSPVTLERWINSLTTDSDGVFSIVDGGGQAIVRSNEGIKVLQTTDEPAVQTLRENERWVGTTKTLAGEGLRLAATVQVLPYAWGVVYEQNIGDAFLGRDTILHTLRWVLGVLVGGAIIFLLWIVRSWLAMRRDRAINEAALLSVAGGLVLTDADGRISFVNKHFEELVGWSSQDALGKHLYQLLPMYDDNGKQLPENDRPVTKALRERITTFSKSSLQYQRKDGRRFPVLVTISPVVQGDDIIGAVEVFYDITKEKDNEKALLAKTSELEKLNRQMVNRELRMIELKQELGRLQSLSQKE